MLHKTKVYILKFYLTIQVLESTETLQEQHWEENEGWELAALYVNVSCV